MGVQVGNGDSEEKKEQTNIQKACDASYKLYNYLLTTLPSNELVSQRAIEDVFDACLKLRFLVDIEMRNQQEEKGSTTVVIRPKLPQGITTQNEKTENQKSAI